MNTSYTQADERFQLRVSRTVATVPDDARTGLEIGFNDLRVTRALRHRLDLISIDLPRQGVVDVATNRLAFASVDRLPFADRSFDIVICTEVLEHLSENVLARGVAELARVTRRYLLISVPFKQRVWNELYRCPDCGHVCNTMGHVRFLDETDLDRLFPAAIAKHRELIGAVTGYAPDLIYKLAYRWGSAWQDLIDPQSCPACGGSPKANHPNMLGWVIQRVIWRLERAVRQKAAWQLCLYELRDGNA